VQKDYTTTASPQVRIKEQKSVWVSYHVMQQ